MIRTRILLLGSLLVAGILLLVIVGVVGSQRISRELAELQLARMNQAEYLELQADAQQLFKQLADSIITGDGASDADIEALRRQTLERIARLRRTIADEVALLGDSAEGEEEKEELDRLADLQSSLTRIRGEFDRIRAMLQSGSSTLLPKEALRQLLDVTIDQQFAALLREAIQIEHDEVLEAEAEAAAAVLLYRVQAVAIAIGTLVIVLAAIALAEVAKRLRDPLAALLAGTRALTAGDLSHRITDYADDEIGEIASSFNAMTARLETQSTEVSRMRDALAAEVAERTTALERALASLREADGLRRRFFADISHELRTPLSRLVDDLLFIARTEAAEPRLQRSAVALDKLVAAACDQMRVVARARARAARHRSGAGSRGARRPCAADPARADPARQCDPLLRSRHADRGPAAPRQRPREPQRHRSRYRRARGRAAAHLRPLPPRA